MIKNCSKCKKGKYLNEFRNDKYGKHGKTSRCKECLATFKPVEMRCWWCPNWFIQKQSNYKFCSSKCHRRFWNKIESTTTKCSLYKKDYWKRYYQENKERLDKKSRKYYLENREKLLENEREKYYKRKIRAIYN